MKALFPILCLLVALTGCASAPAPASKAGAVPGVEAPRLAAGQAWTFRRIDLWKKEETERFTQTLDNQTNGRWIVAWTVLSSSEPARMGTTPERFDPLTHSFSDSRMGGRYEPLRFPLSEGKTWTFRYTYQSKSRAVIEVTQTATVKGWETVNLPAGTFRTLRVEHLGWYVARDESRQWSGRITETFWYAPTARRIVAQEYKDTTGVGTAWEQRRDELVSLQLEWQ